MSNRVFISEVSHAIEEHFKRVGLTQVMAAQLLGVTPQAVSLQLRQPFGKNVSAKWEKAFGFNRVFLMTGKGELISPDIDFTPAKKEDKSFQKIDLEDFVCHNHWDSQKDYESALTLAHAALSQIGDFKAEIDYYIRENQKLVEENKKLFIENSALRRIGKRK